MRLSCHPVAVAMATAVLALTLLPAAWGDTSTTGTSTTTPDFDQTCDDVLNLASGIEAAGQNADNRATQKLTYCQAAQQSQKAASSNGLLWKVWAGVAGVCSFQCIASFTGVGAGSQYICTGADVAAGVTDAVTTKNFASALGAIGSAAAGIVINRISNPKTTASATTPTGTDSTAAPKKAATKKNWGACIAAATATMSVFTKRSAESTATQTENQNLVYAAQLGPVTSVLGTTTVTAQPVGTNVVTNSSLRVEHVLGSSYSGSAAAAGGSDCGGAANSGDSAKVISCASAVDNSVPSWVASAPFNQALKAATGNSVGDFVASATDPSSAITSAAGGLPEAASGQLSQLVGAAAKSVNANAIATAPGETTYASHGGAPESAAEKEEGIDPAAIGQVMAKLMKGIKPGKEEPEDPRNIKFAGKPSVPAWLRGPASSEEDQTFTLFDRVTYRYYFVGRKIYFDDDPTLGGK